MARMRRLIATYPYVSASRARGYCSRPISDDTNVVTPTILPKLAGPKRLPVYANRHENSVTLCV